MELFSPPSCFPHWFDVDQPDWLVNALDLVNALQSDHQLAIHQQGKSITTV